MSTELKSAFRDIPFLPPPPGQTSNFINPESRGPLVIILCSICLVLMWPVVIMRLYSKAFDLHKFWWDDASCILAAVLLSIFPPYLTDWCKIGSTSYAAAAIWSMNVLGPHGWNVRIADFSGQFIMVEIAVFEIVYGPTIFFAKLALFLLYFRVFSPKKWMKFAIQAGIVINCLFYAATSMVFGVKCVRRPGQSWLEAASTDRCRSTVNMNYIQGIFGIVSDIYIFVLPFPVLWGLQMTLRKKVGVSGIFFTGLLAIVASSYFLYYRVGDPRSADITWRIPPTLALAFISIIEMSLGVICSSFPYLPALFTRHKSGLSSLVNSPYQIYKWATSRIKSSSELPLSRSSQAPSSAPQKPQVHITTGVLGSIRGDGKFVKSGRFGKKWEASSQTSMGTLRNHAGDPVLEIG